MRRGELLAGIGGVALLVALFLPWFEPGRSGFSSLAIADLFIAAAALMAIALPLFSAVQEKTDLPIVWAALTVLGSTFALVIAGFRVIDPIGGGREAGLYLALGSSLLVLGGAWSAIADEGP